MKVPLFRHPWSLLWLVLCSVLCGRHFTSNEAAAPPRRLHAVDVVAQVADNGLRPPAYDIARQRVLAAAKAEAAAAAVVVGTPNEFLQDSKNASAWLDDDFGSLLDGGLPLPLTRRLRHLASGDKSMESAELYGGVYDYAYYFISVLVGTPPQRQSVILDSGSSLLGFSCADCVHCGKQHIDRGFNMTASSTAEWLTCDDSRCLTRRCGSKPTSLEGNKVSTCRYIQSYSEGSSIEGTFFSDMVAIGEQRDNSRAIRFDYIGCHDLETNLFTTQKASGILGVSYPKRGKQPTLIDTLFSSPGVDTKVFAICAAEEGGRLSVGGFDSSRHRHSRTVAAASRSLISIAQRFRHDENYRSHWKAAFLPKKRGLSDENGFVAEYDEPTDYLEVLHREFVEEKSELHAKGPSYRALGDASSDANDGSLEETHAKLPEIAWTPMTSNSHYEIGISSMGVVQSDGKVQEIASASDIGSVIVDSGTTFSYLATNAFKAFMRTMNDACEKNFPEHCVSRATSSSDQQCWRISSPEDFANVPSFMLTLGSGAVVEWQPQSYLHRRARTEQWCIAVDDNLSRQTILGMSFLKQQDVIFDRERDMVGFVSAECETVSDKERPPPPTRPPVALLSSPPLLASSLAADGAPGKTPQAAQAQQNWVDKTSDNYIAVATLSVGDESGQGQGYKPFVMWAAGGSAVGACVLGMAVITRRSIRRRAEYSFAPDTSPSFAPYDHVQVVHVRTGETQSTTTAHDLESAINDELEQQQV